MALQQTQTPAEEAALRAAGLAIRLAGWVKRIARRFGLESTLRPRGRPRKDTYNGSSHLFASTFSPPDTLLTPFRLKPGNVVWLDFLRQACFLCKSKESWSLSKQKAMTRC